MKYIYIVALLFVMAGCNTNQNRGHTHDSVTGNGEHVHEEGALSYTLFSDHYELFVEFPALVAGQTSPFAAHVTELDTYKPVSQGRLTVSLIQGNRGIRQSVDHPSSPGIFRPSLQPKEAGLYKLLFTLETDTGSIIFDIPEFIVYSNAEEAAHRVPEEQHDDAISFLKEQAWKTDFHTLEITPQPFYSVIHTSGKVINPPQSQTSINAQIGGTIQLFSVLGQSVKQGDLLALISGTGVDKNMNLRLNESMISFEKSKADYLRSLPLAEKQIISKKDFLDIEARYKQDSLQYNQLARLVSQNGLRITAPANGFITRLNVENGQFIEAGSPVITISSQNELLIETYVNQSDLQRVNGIFDANFKLPRQNQIISLNEVNGRIRSKNAFVNENAFRIPVTFSVTNNEMLMPGMFLEAFLFTGQKEDAIVVPFTSVIEEHGHYYVFVQTGGESFLKRQVYLAGNDGKNVEIHSGLQNGDRIVTRGAYQIKLAELSGDLPIHGHTH
jgi:membrane fusion protein, heavy metal efflux system